MHADAEIVSFSGLVGLVPIGAAVASSVEAVGHVLRSAIVSRGDDAVVEHDDCTDAISLAVGAQANRHRNVHEIFVAVRARIARGLRLVRRFRISIRSSRRRSRDGHRFRISVVFSHDVSRRRILCPKKCRDGRIRPSRRSEARRAAGHFGTRARRTYPRMESVYQLSSVGMDHRSWLTAKRLRAHGLLLALTLWGLYIWTLATPGLRDRNRNLKGTDFLHFYTLGSVAIERRGADLYSIDAQGALAGQRVPAAQGIRYLPLYPPQVSLLFAPFAHLTYPWALALWWLCTALIYGACCYAVWRSCPRLKQHGLTVIILAAGFPGFFNLIAWGQTSALALACFTILFLLLKKKRDYLAGIAIGCLIFKPQLGLAAGIVFVTLGAWRIVIGATLSAIAQLSIGALYYGIAPVRTWLSMLSDAPALSTVLEPKPYQTHCLRTFWSMLIPWSSLSIGLYVISAAIVIVWTLLVWKRSQDWALRFSMLLWATVLVSPHLTVYDLMILAPAFLLLSDWAIAHPQRRHSGLIGTMLYLAYVLPLAGPLLRRTHMQLSVVAMSILAYLVMRSVETDNADQPLDSQSTRRVAAI
jgi:hypothetical protein